MEQKKRFKDLNGFCKDKVGLFSYSEVKKELPLEHLEHFNYHLKKDSFYKAIIISSDKFILSQFIDFIKIPLTNIETKWGNENLFINKVFFKPFDYLDLNIYYWLYISKKEPYCILFEMDHNYSGIFKTAEKINSLTKKVFEELILPEITYFNKTNKSKIIVLKNF